MANRWVRDSSNPAYVALEKLFNDGSIDPNTLPRAIYDTNESFQYSLGVF